MDEKLKELHIKAGKKAGEEKTCGKKIRYSEKSALKAAEKMNKKPTTRNELEAYPCAFCEKWHIGRKMTEEYLETFLK